MELPDEFAESEVAGSYEPLEWWKAFADPAISFTRRWRPGDVAVWDEHRTVHRGPNDFAPHARKLHRCTAGSRRPTASTETA